jgi:hypothetical protein
MTPEQRLRSKLTSTIGHVLPKGSFLLQPVETNTVGVPDFYLAYVIGSQLYHKTDRTEAYYLKSRSCWIETKTLDYNVDKFQMNWYHRHAATGGDTVLCTLIQLDKLPPKQRANFQQLVNLTNKNHPNNPTQTPFPGHTATLQQPQTTTPNPTPTTLHPSTPTRSNSGLYILNFDPKQLDYSTLGSYIQKERPALVALEDWLLNS